MRQSDNIYLLGYMGSGKSTLGPLLASGLNRRFIDLDEFIEKRAVKSVNEIFKQDGELEFRKLEKTFLAECASIQNQVIALGGGAPLDPENWHIMLTTGITVYLELPVSDLIQRLEGDREKRPLLAGLDNEQLKAFINAHFKKREPVYQRANLCVPATIAVQELIQTLHSYSR